MYLSSEQEYLLHFLQRMGCLRQEQAAAILRRKFDTPQKAMPAIIRQLRSAGQLREHAGVLIEPARSTSPAMLRAIDVLLAVFPAELPEATVSGRPLQITAYDAVRDLQLQILHVPAGKERETCGNAGRMPSTDIPTMLVLLLDAEEQRDHVKLNRIAYLLAYPDQAGRLHMEKREQEGTAHG